LNKIIQEQEFGFGRIGILGLGMGKGGKKNKSAVPPPPLPEKLSYIISTLSPIPNAGRTRLPSD
jgi:hypothetical protein